MQTKSAMQTFEGKTFPITSGDIPTDRTSLARVSAINENKGKIKIFFEGVFIGAIIVAIVFLVIKWI